MVVYDIRQPGRWSYCAFWYTPPGKILWFLTKRIYTIVDIRWFLYYVCRNEMPYVTDNVNKKER